jgi:hypothetical protein
VKTESDKVGSEEYVFRRILNRDQEIDFSLSRPVQGLAFNPTNSDIDGLSLFRELFATAGKVAREGRNPLGYFVARIPVSEIIHLGLSVRPDPREGFLPGHSLIPELTCLIDKRTKRDLRNRLAQLVNRNVGERIVYRPL